MAKSGRFEGGSAGYQSGFPRLRKKGLPHGMQESKVTPTCSVSILVSTIVVRDCGHTNFSGHKVQAKGVDGKLPHYGAYGTRQGLWALCSTSNLGSKVYELAFPLADGIDAVQL